jgi:hypothetical protein
MRYLQWLVGATGLLLMAVALAALDNTLKIGPTVIDSRPGFHSESTVGTINLWPPLALLLGVALVSVALLGMKCGSAKK